MISKAEIKKIKLKIADVITSLPYNRKLSAIVDRLIN